MPWQHIWPTTLYTPDWLSSSFVSGVSQDAAEAGCSCKKCLPSFSCTLYSPMTYFRWTRATRNLSSTTAFSMRGWLRLMFIRHQSVQGGLPIIR